MDLHVSWIKSYIYIYTSYMIGPSVDQRSGLTNRIRGHAAHVWCVSDSGEARRRRGRGWPFWRRRRRPPRCTPRRWWPRGGGAPAPRGSWGGDLLRAGVRAGARGLLLQQHLHALLLVARAEAQRGALGQWALPFPHSLRTFTAAFNRETSGLFRHMYVLKVTVDGLYF